MFCMEIRQEEEIIDIQVENEEVKLSLCADDKILYVENYKKYINTLLELIKQVSSAGWRIQLHFHILQ